MIEAADWPVWLGQGEGDPTALLRPAGEDVLRFWPVSTRVEALRPAAVSLSEHGLIVLGDSATLHG